jgi:hypothetical protein
MGRKPSITCLLVRTQPRGLATNAASLQLTGTYPIPGGSIVDCSKKEGAEGNERRKAFVSVFALVSWSLWLERNARVFNDRGTSASVLADLIWAQVDLWCPTRLIIGRTWQESGGFFFAGGFVGGLSSLYSLSKCAHTILKKTYFCIFLSLDGSDHQNSDTDTKFGQRKTA